MPWALRNVASPSFTSDARSGSGGLDVTLPSYQVNDILVMGASARPSNGFTVGSPPTGWSSLRDGTANETKLFVKIAAASEATPNVVCSETGAFGACIAAFSGGPASLAGILHASALADSGGSLVEDIATAALTITIAQTLELYFGAASGNEWVAGTQPNGASVLCAANFAGAFNNLWLGFAYRVQGAAASLAASKFDTTSVNTVRTNSIVASLVPGQTSAAAAQAYYRSLLVR
ncbi:MAG TPA: hypothetical protein PLX85_00550 [Dehalococcoidia bacterium]|nr:hypothetical protein [Dehalococcoidia bacterium]